MGVATTNDNHLTTSVAPAHKNLHHKDASHNIHVGTFKSYAHVTHNGMTTRAQTHQLTYEVPNHSLITRDP